MVGLFEVEDPTCVGNPPPEATHYWYAENKDRGPFKGDELAAYMWGLWVLSMQDEWERKYAYSG